MPSFGTAVAESLTRAQEMLRARRYAQALQVCTQALARGVDDPRLRLIAAHSLLAQGLQQRAKQEAQQVLRLDPGQAEAHRLLADIAQSEGQVGTACEHLQCVLEIDPVDEHARTVYETLSRWSDGPASVRRATQPSAVSQLSMRATSTARFVERFEHNFDVVPRGEADDSGIQPLTESMIEELDSRDVEEAGDPTPTPTTIDSAARALLLRDPDAAGGARAAAPAPAPAHASSGLPTPGLANAASSAFSAMDGTSEFGNQAVTVPVAQAAEPRPGWAPFGVKDVAPWSAPTGFKQTLGLPFDDDFEEDDGSSDDDPTVLRSRPRAPEGSEQPRLDPLALQEVATGSPESRELAWEPTRIDRSSARHAALRSEEDADIALGKLPAIRSEDQRYDEFSIEPASAPVVVDGTASKTPFGAAGPASQPVERPLGSAPDPHGFSAPTPVRNVVPFEREDEFLRPATARARGSSDPLTGHVGDMTSTPDSMIQLLTGAASPPGAGFAGATGSAFDDAWDPLADAAQAPLQHAGLAHAAAPHAALPQAALAHAGASARHPALTPPDSMERELMAGGVGLPVVHEPGGRWRVILALVGAFLVGAGGLYAFLIYRNYRYVRTEWVQLRTGLREGTLVGLERATVSARRVLAKNRNNKEAIAALAMCEAAAAYEFGENRLASAKQALERSKGSDSEWRTVAGGYLALMEDPTVAVGYLKKGTEVYPDSALLAYLEGRALASAGSAEQAINSYREALKKASDFEAAQVALASHIGQTPGGFAQALDMLDALLRRQPNHVEALLARARLRTEQAKQLQEALADAHRVSDELKERASSGQRGWANLIVAKIARTRGDLKAMSAALDAAVAAPPCCDDEFSYEVAGELQSLFRLVEARGQMERALRHKPKHAAYLRRMGRILLDLGEPKAAEPYILAAPAHHAQTKLLKGRLAFTLGQYKEAEAMLKGAASEAATRLEAKLYLALTRAKLGDSAGAASALRALQAANPRADIVPQALGRVYLDTGRYNEAEEALKQAWRLNTLDPLTPTLLGFVSMAQQDTVRAVKRFERALEGHAHYTLAHIGMAELLRRTRNYAAARSQAQKVPEADRSRAEYLALEARLALAEGQRSEAEAALRALKTRGGPEGAPHVTRIEGHLALLEGKTKQAVELLDQAYKADPRDADLGVTLAQALLRADRVDDAFDLLESVLQIDPGHPDALLQLGKISIKDGEFVFALQRMTKALTQMRERQWPKQLQSVAFTALAEAYLARGDTGQALTNLQDAMDLDPKAARPNFLMGKTYDKLERPARAVPYYLKAAELAPTFTEASLAAAEASSKAGDKVTAIKQLDALIAESKDRSAVARAQRLRARLN